MSDIKREKEREDCGMWEREQKVNGSKKKGRQEKKMTRQRERERERAREEEEEV